MTDQPGLSDDNGAAGPRFASIEEVQSLTQRFTSQDQRLDEIVRILRAQITATPSSYLSTVPIVQEGSALTVQATHCNFFIVIW
ncbi:hypothetical protein Syun_013863 [Stephania yunnanensis]|uniref:Uncharacterized protein n=1 Tax=Stephania yunnanensis TaxID=152371 RepID=A0AAP0JI55_9MAGN